MRIIDAGDFLKVREDFTIPRQDQILTKTKRRKYRLSNKLALASSIRFFATILLLRILFAKFFCTMSATALALNWSGGAPAIPGDTAAASLLEVLTAAAAAAAVSLFEVLTQVAGAGAGGAELVAVVLMLLVTVAGTELVLAWTRENILKLMK